MTGPADRNREAWLAALVERLRPDFAAAGAPLPPVVHVSVGFPSKNGLGKHRRTVGQCWSPEASEDHAPHVFVSPLLPQEEADHVLVHELVHAAVGTAAGHGPAFRRVAVKLGLAGPMRSTVCGPGLRERLDGLAAEIGPYPHPTLRAGVKERKGSRLLKAVCGCGRILRLSRQEADRGPVVCGLCGQPYVVEGQGQGEE